MTYLLDGMLGSALFLFLCRDLRFEDMRESMERFDYGLSGVEKGAGRVKGRVGGASSQPPAQVVWEE